MQFIVTSAGPDKLDLAEICQRHADELWVPAHLDAEQAAEFVLDHFRRAVAQELELLDVKMTDSGHSG